MGVPVQATSPFLLQKFHFLHLGKKKGLSRWWPGLAPSPRNTLRWLSAALRCAVEFACSYCVCSSFPLCSPASSRSWQKRFAFCTVKVQTLVWKKKIIIILWYWFKAVTEANVRKLVLKCTKVKSFLFYVINETTNSSLCSTHFFLCTENVLNSDPKAKVLKNNLPVQYDPLFYSTAQQWQQSSNSSTWSNGYDNRFFFSIFCHLKNWRQKWMDCFL